MAKEYVEMLDEEHGRGKDSGEVLHADVSFDGTWLTRGHKSHIGATFVMDMFSGMVLDREVPSNFCGVGTIMKKKKDKKCFDEWCSTEHSGKCYMNFASLSGAMERSGESVE